MIGTSTSDNDYFVKGKKCALYFDGPYDSNYKDVEYASYKITYKADELSTSVTSYLSDITVTSNIGTDNVIAEVTNNGNGEPQYTVISIVFYADGVPVGYKYTFADVEAPGSVDYLELSFPRDSDYNAYAVDDYKIFINYSFSYTW